MKGLTVYVHPCNDSYMSTQTLEVRFTAKRACYWDNASHRWITFGRDKAQELIALGQAIELKAGQWI